MNKDCQCIQIYKEKLKGLVDEWTKQALSSFNNDDERLVYYQCAEKLFEVLKEDKK